MGLDIYAHKVSNAETSSKGINIESTPKEIMDVINSLSREEFANRMNKRLEKLRKVAVKTPLEYENAYNKFVEELGKKEPKFKEYDFYLSAFKERTLNLTELEELVENHIKHYYALEDAYFRKVNFIYEYFRNLLVDECCKVTKDDIKALIDTCADVLKHNGDEDYARLYLPTTGGFFFGSTEYDDWYWVAVKNCLKQMKKLHKSMKDEDFVLWIFSW
jgi:hypothetical protein